MNNIIMDASMPKLFNTMSHSLESFSEISFLSENNLEENIKYN